MVKTIGSQHFKTTYSGKKEDTINSGKKGQTSSGIQAIFPRLNTKRSRKGRKYFEKDESIMQISQLRTFNSTSVVVNNRVIEINSQT